MKIILFLTLLISIILLFMALRPILEGRALSRLPPNRTLSLEQTKYKLKRNNKYYGSKRTKRNR